MSNHPYGLRGDPFALPATLSAKDASKLIRRRVRAFNGDGGALFPIDTCDLIHELAGGVPDTMLQLAGRALRIAADENAPAVSPAHVSKALASVAAEAPPTPPPSAERAARAIEVEIEAAEAAVDAAIAAASTRMEAEASAEAPAARETHSETAAATIDFDDPDLPPFQPAAFALPTQPSENLDEDARDWVSRFIPGSGAMPAAMHAAHARRATTTHDVEPEPEMTHSARPEPATVSLPELATLYAAHAPRPKLRPAPRRRRRQGGHGLIMAFAAVVVVAFVVRMSLRGNLVAPWSQPEPPARASTRAIRPTAPEPAVVRKARPESPERPTGGQVTPGFSTATGPDAAARKTPTVASLPGLVPAPTIGTKPVDSAAQVAAAPPRPVAPYALEVATFIFEDRARMERDRLSASGLRARVVTTVEYGSRVYRVVLSGYVDPAAAERAADSLLTTGAVLQARVIRFP